MTKQERIDEFVKEFRKKVPMNREQCETLKFELELFANETEREVRLKNQ